MTRYEELRRQYEAATVDHPEPIPLFEWRYVTVSWPLSRELHQKWRVYGPDGWTEEWVEVPEAMP